MNIYKEIGLTIYEGKVYESLLSLEKAKATKISELSKVPQTAVYPSLKKLEEKGLIQKLNGDISQFEIINPKIAVAKLISSKQKDLEKLKQKAVENFNLLRKNKIQERKKLIEIGAGKEFSEEIYYDVFENSKKSIYILGWRFENVGDKYNVLKRFRKPLKNKVDIRLILIGDKSKKQVQLIKDYTDAGVKIRFLPLDDFSLLISDDKTCKITIKKPNEEKISINILDENFVNFLNQYYLDLWNKAETFD